MIAIRAAAPADAEALAALRWEFRAGREDPVETRDAFTARCGAWMRRELQAGAPWHAWLALEDDLACGQVWLQIVGKLPNPVGEKTRHGYVSNLYVRPAVRGGVGTRLLTAALDFARANAVDRVVLWPSARSVSLYTRFGFVRGADSMELKL